MKLTKGSLLRVKTRTKEDVFGDCLYEIIDTGLTFPKNQTEKVTDGVKCVMLGGSGPSARSGLTIFDSEAVILGNIAEGIAQVVPESQRPKVLKFYQDNKKENKNRATSKTGVVELG